MQRRHEAAPNRFRHRIGFAQSASFIFFCQLGKSFTLAFTDFIFSLLFEQTAEKLAVFYF